MERLTLREKKEWFYENLIIQSPLYQSSAELFLYKRISTAIAVLWDLIESQIEYKLNEKVK